MSIRTRALLAVALLLGFYALALGMAGGLLWIAYEAVVITKSGAAFKLAIFCVVGAFLIARAILPRRDHFDAPGPRITAEEHPRLFARIHEVAAATDQRPPAEVYLVPEVNAWVMQRGGVLGVGSRRVMGIGLPLMELLSVAELRAVVAHEFGHYVSGDTSLGPWIYRTRAALERAFRDVSEHSGLLAKPFEWYGRAFLRITHAVSRAQEYVADATAARVAGSEAARRALVRIAGGAAAYGSYWQSELVPTLEAGYRPPIVGGFRQFLAAPSVRPQVEKMVDEELASGATDPYDTHPSLRDRLAAIERLPATGGIVRDAASDDAPAVSLLEHLDRAEAALIAAIAPSEAARLQAISWEEVPRVVLAEGWRRTAAPAAAALAGITPEQLASLVTDRDALVARFARAMPRDLDAEHREPFARAVLGSALALLLLDRPDARLEAPPGESVRFVSAGGAELLPFVDVEALRDGSLGAEAWRARCGAMGVLGLDLGLAAGRAGAGGALAGGAPTTTPAR